MRQKIPSWNRFVQPFAEIFSAPSRENFLLLCTAWILAQGSHTITGLLQTASRRAKINKHFSVFHRFFSRANWHLDDLGLVIVKLLDAFIGSDIVLIVDDTLCRRSGPRILGAGMHHDPLISSGTGQKHTGFAFGLNFVVLALWLKVPFSHSGGIAVPFLVRLYRSKRTCPKHLYRKRTELAAQLVALAAKWFCGRSIIVLGDNEYACETLLSALPQGVDFCGPLPMNASLHAVQLANTKSRGRPRLWGQRLACPNQLLENKQTDFEKQSVHIYGSDVVIEHHRFNAVWKSAGHKRILSIVVSRDPSGRYKPSAFFSTRKDDPSEQVLCEHAKRWELEVAFRNTKQHLGLEQTANGFTRRRRRTKKRPGPQAMPGRLPIASERTAPFAFVVYAITVAWYLRHGKPRADMAFVRKFSPWYRHKKSISFSDMLAALRRSLDPVTHFSRPRRKPAFAKIRPTPRQLAEMAA